MTELENMNTALDSLASVMELLGTEETMDNLIKYEGLGEYNRFAENLVNFLNVASVDDLSAESVVDEFARWIGTGDLTDALDYIAGCYDLDVDDDGNAY